MKILKRIDSPQTNSLAPVTCLDEGADVCPKMDLCRTLSLWKRLNQVMQDYLEHVTIADLMKEYPTGWSKTFNKWRFI